MLLRCNNSKRNSLVTCRGNVDKQNERIRDLEQEVRLLKAKLRETTDKSPSLVRFLDEDSGSLPATADDASIEVRAETMIDTKGEPGPTAEGEPGSEAITPTPIGSEQLRHTDRVISDHDHSTLIEV